jgi:putative hydrolase of the HAD superfamily
MSLKAVLFDLDDTLYDHQHCCRTALRIIHQQHECFLAVPFDEFERQHSEFLEANHLKVLQGTLTLDGARLERMRQLFSLYGECPPEDVLHEVVHSYREHYLGAECCVDGAVVLLEQLRAENIGIAIVTNNTHDEQVRKLKRLNLTHLIDLLVTSEAAGFAKPDPRIFATTLERLGCQPDDVVVVGDSWSADIVGAHNAGIRAVWLNRYGTPCPDVALAAEIRSLEPIDAVLNSLLMPKSNTPVME